MNKELLEKNVGILKKAVFGQVGLLAVAIVCIIVGILTSAKSPSVGDWLSRIGIVAGALSIVPYLLAIVYAYLVQDQLKKEGLYPHGAWHLVVAALILNPFIAGWWPPLSTYLTAKGYLEPQDKGFSLGLK